jgi:hypothetical protein
VHPREETKKIFCKGEILKDFFQGIKAKLAYFARGKDIFTQIININNYSIILIFNMYEKRSSEFNF